MVPCNDKLMYYKLTSNYHPLPFCFFELKHIFKCFDFIFTNKLLIYYNLIDNFMNFSVFIEFKEKVIK